ncbi:unnamed protein product [Phaeothamnion confervicola]
MPHNTTPTLGQKKGGKYGATAMSVPNFDIGGQNAARFNRSLSVGPGMTASNLNPEQRNRRMLYVNLPFLSISGMQFREQSIARSLSRVGLEAAGETPEEAALLAVDVDEVILTWPLMAAVFAAVILEFVVGYNIGVMNAPEPVVFPGHTTTQWSLAVSVFAIGGPFGAVLAGKIANLKGRRMAIVLNAWVFLFGGLLFALAPSIYWLIPARFIIGFGSGYASVIVPIYLGELAPPTLRGTLGTLTQFSMVIGILAANLLAFPLATADGWRWLFGVTAVLALLQLMCSALIFESPRWLLNRDAFSLEARVALKKLRGFRNDEEVQMEVDHIVEASNMQRLKYNSAHAAGAVWDLLTDRAVRPLVVGFVVLHVAQQLSGINAVFYYSTSFFQGVIDNPMVGTTLAGTVNVVATYCALQLMDRTGRVTLLLWSAGGMVVCCIALTVALLGYLPNYVALLAVMGFVTFFEFGLGPIPWLIVAEMFDAKYVATGMSVASQINWGCNFIIGIGFPYLNAALGPWCFVPFAAVLICTFAYTKLYMPETAGRTVQEIQRIVAGPTEYDIKNNNGMQFVVVEGVDLSVN